MFLLLDGDGPPPHLLFLSLYRYHYNHILRPILLLLIVFHVLSLDKTLQKNVYKKKMMYNSPSLPPMPHNISTSFQKSNKRIQNSVALA